MLVIISRATVVRPTAGRGNRDVRVERGDHDVVHLRVRDREALDAERRTIGESGANILVRQREAGRTLIGDRTDVVVTEKVLIQNVVLQALVISPGEKIQKA